MDGPITSTQTEREEAYLQRFGTRHPKTDQLVEWAGQIFPEAKEISLRHGLFACPVMGNGVRVVRHLKRFGLMVDGKVAAVGIDGVEAIAIAEIKQNRLIAARAAEESKTKQKDPAP